MIGKLLQRFPVLMRVAFKIALRIKPEYIVVTILRAALESQGIKATDELLFQLVERSYKALCLANTKDKNPENSVQSVAEKSLTREQILSET